MDSADAIVETRAMVLPDRRSIAGERGAVPGGAEWLAIATQLERIAAGIPLRMRRRGASSQALAVFIADDILRAAGEIRANLALEELFAWPNR